MTSGAAAATAFKLELTDGTHADPPSFRAAVPTGEQATRFTCRNGLSVSCASENEAAHAPVLVVLRRNIP